MAPELSVFLKLCVNTEEVDVIWGKQNTPNQVLRFNKYSNSIFFICFCSIMYRIKEKPITEGINKR